MSSPTCDQALGDLFDGVPALLKGQDLDGEVPHHALLVELTLRIVDGGPRAGRPPLG